MHHINELIVLVFRILQLIKQLFLSIQMVLLN